MRDCIEKIFVVEGAQTPAPTSLRLGLLDLTAKEI